MKTFICITTIFLTSVVLTAQVKTDQDDIEKEIRRLRKELSEIQNERQRNSMDLQNDKKEYDSYRETTAKRF